MKGLVTVFGGSGFVGGQIVRVLAKHGHRIRVAVRQPGRAYRVRMLGDVGQIEVVQANVRAPASVGRALEGAEACVNAVGVLFETGRQKFMSVHAMGARNIAEAARVRGVERFVQISAIGADAHSPAKYARTKAEGEAAVRGLIPGAVVLRPSVVFGPEDHFFNRFASLALIAPALPLIGGGHTRFQPVFVGDVAAAVAAVLAQPETAGGTYELGGPNVHSFRELMELLLRDIGRKRLLVPLPFAIARLMAVGGDVMAALQPLVPAPPITSDQVELLRVDNVVGAGVPDLASLGVSATAMDGVLPSYLSRYRPGGQYADLVANAPT